MDATQCEYCESVTFHLIDGEIMCQQCGGTQKKVVVEEIEDE